MRIDPTYRRPVYHVEDQRYDLLGEWLTTDIGTFFLVALDALAMADDVAHGRPPFDEWSSENYAVSFTPSALLITNLWVPGAEGEFPAGVAREAIEDYWSFLVGQPERDVVREYRPDLPEWQANLLRWEEKWGRPHPYRGRLF
ncbi:hypothetical protein [Actinoplanes solisilvae]|uniref:hypothetical protein n=1 Tax=Actinoplanes solisilvae TaxID=2486853 RepID=UPI001F0C4773|nr:hypothetical protein [Actinoplanes solisilvae]